MAAPLPPLLSPYSHFLLSLLGLASSSGERSKNLRFSWCVYCDFWRREWRPESSGCPLGFSFCLRDFRSYLCSYMLLFMRLCPSDFLLGSSLSVVFCLDRLMFYRVMNKMPKWFELIPLVHQDPSCFSFWQKNLCSWLRSWFLGVWINPGRWFFGDRFVLSWISSVQFFRTFHGVFVWFCLIFGSLFSLFVSSGGAACCVRSVDVSCGFLQVEPAVVLPTSST
jgi:hypothetical protein